MGMKRKNKPRLFILLSLVAMLSAVNPSPAFGREKDKKKHAQIEVSGIGWWANREQRASLTRLLGEERGETLDANGIEDAAFLLMSAVIDEGYSKPTIEARLTKPNGEKISFTFDSAMEATLPRPFEASKIEFKVKQGVRYRFHDVVISGLRVIPDAVAREYFLGEKVLLRRAAANYSASNLNRGVDGLQDDLHRRGYADAQVKASDVHINEKTGEVDVKVQVVEGPLWKVTSLRVDDPAAKDGEPHVDVGKFIGQPWSQFWQQDVAGAVRNAYYRRGFPDVHVRVRSETAKEKDGIKSVAAVARVESGPEVHVGNVRFEGAKRTKEKVLERRVNTLPGKLLNPLEMDQARFRLGRLGVFESVDLHYEPATGDVRDAVFVVREGRDLETNLLFGYGSYEQVRGGVEMRQFNLFGRAHQTRLLLVQSMKSSRGEYSYTVPELFGESLDGSARVFGLQRQETSFLRQEYGGTVSMSAPLHAIGANSTLGYTYQSLSNRNNTLSTSSADEKQVSAASIDISLVRDRRDNPLRPRRGYRWFAQAETASHFFGGTVDYQRIEFGGSYHTSAGAGRWVHLGINHGVITTFGADDSELPVNKRFFPGGDNSIRGYRSGEAAPRDPTGKFIGAKSYILANVEFEQALTAKWSAVVFFDALGTAVRLADYPWAEQLNSAGLGVRYQTLIGPLRLEYGRNLNPRPADPGGTFLFSIGFPF
jgi:outer membrane protein insertion porin family